METEVQISQEEQGKIDAVAERVKDAIATAESVSVTTQAEANRATEIVSEIAKRRRQAEVDRTFIVKPMNDHVKAINARFREITEPLDAADKIVRARLTDYARKQEERRREEQARLDAEHRDRERHAREVREREEAAARFKREEAEKAAREAEEAAKAGDKAAQEEAERKAMELDAAKADALDVEDEPEALPAPVVPDAAPLKSESGAVSSRKVWKFEIEEVGIVPRAYLVVDEKAIREAVRNGAREIPGVRIYQDTQLAVRTST